MGTISGAVLSSSSLGGEGNVAQGTGSETKCCAPAERCDTAQDGQETTVTQKTIKLHYAHQIHQISTGYIAGVGPLNNKSGEAPNTPP